MYGEDAEEFRPERFLNAEETGLDGSVRYPDLTFGWGRRVCPGKGLATDELFLAVASVLKVFDIRRKGSEQVKPEYTTGLLRSVLWCKVSSSALILWTAILFPLHVKSHQGLVKQGLC